LVLVLGSEEAGPSAPLQDDKSLGGEKKQMLDNWLCEFIPVFRKTGARMRRILNFGGTALVAACTLFGALLVAIPGGAAFAQAGATDIPEVGTEAPEFALSTPQGKEVKLSALLGKKMVVLIVLRGYPGTQSPECQKQVHDFKAKADKFRAQGVELLLVYPGPPDQASAKAREFLTPEGSLPSNFHLVVDPDYKVTTRYGLRWDAPQETAYPSTFVIARDGEVRFRKVSREHGDRTSADEVLALVEKARQEDGEAVPR
jgi:peroxiredoxin